MAFYHPWQILELLRDPDRTTGDKVFAVVWALVFIGGIVVIFVVGMKDGS